MVKLGSLAPSIERAAYYHCSRLGQYCKNKYLLDSCAGQEIVTTFRWDLKETMKRRQAYFSALGSAEQAGAQPTIKGMCTAHSAFVWNGSFRKRFFASTECWQTYWWALQSGHNFECIAGLAYHFCVHVIQGFHRCDEVDFGIQHWRLWQLEWHHEWEWHVWVRNPIEWGPWLTWRLERAGTKPQWQTAQTLSNYHGDSVLVILVLDGLCARHCFWVQNFIPWRRKIW